MRQVAACCVMLYVSPSGERYVLLGYHSRKGGWENCGGKNEGNETLLQTAKREMQEETGIDPESLSIPISPVSVFDEEDNWLCVIYLATFSKMHAPRITEQWNHREWRWVRVEDLPALRGDMTLAGRRTLQIVGLLV